MNTTQTVATGWLFALCGCCTDHAADGPLEHVIVTCRECGAPCSCRGCVAEAD